MKKVVCLLIIFFLFSSTSFAQSYARKMVFEDWFTGDGIQSFFIKGKVITTSSHTFLCGASINSQGNYDILVSKYANSNGAVVWTNQYNGTGNGLDFANGIALDASGNVYICGSTYRGTQDSNDCIIQKYNGTSGTLVWSAFYNGPSSGNDGLFDIAVENGKLFATGSSYDTLTGYDVITLHYDTSGTFSWAARYDYSNLMDGGYKLSYSSSNNRLDIVGVGQASAADFDYITLSYIASTGVLRSSSSASGSTNGFDEIGGIALDTLGNIYITGGVTNQSTGYDFLTIKMDSNLVTQWSSTYNGSSNGNDKARDIVVDYDGNVYVCGYETDSLQGANFTTIKYSNSGTQLWKNNFNGKGNAGDTAIALILDPWSRDLVVAGSTFNGVTYDYQTIKYDSAGTEIWRIDFNSWENGNDFVRDLAFDSTGAIIVTGQSQIPGTISYKTVRYIEMDVIVPPDTCLIGRGIEFTQNRTQLIFTGTQNVANNIKFYNTKTTPSLFFSDTALSYVFSRIDRDTATTDSLHRFDMKFNNSNPGRKIVSMDRNEDFFSNFFLSHIPEGRVFVPDYNKLTHNNIWPKIDAIYSNNVFGLKFYFVVWPFANPSNINWSYQGADSVNIGPNGELRVYTKCGTLIMPKADAFEIDPNGNFSGLNWNPTYTISNGQITLSNLGSYTNSRTLVFGFKWGDPPTPQHGLSPEYSMPLGGSGDDEGTSVTTDSDGNSYFCGFTSSSDLTFLGNNGFYPNFSSVYDCYIRKYGTPYGPYPSQDADKVKWATFWGGSGDDRAFSITAKGNGNSGLCLLTGFTGSSDFPTWSAGGQYYRGTNAGGRDAFIIGIDNLTGGAQNPATRWSTYFGGTGNDEGYSIVADQTGNFFIGGQTTSNIYSGTSCQNSPNNDSFPKCNTWSAYTNNNSFGGVGDGFIARFNSTGGITWSTFYGGDQWDGISSLVLDGNGHLFGTGSTGGGSFPTLTNSGAYNQTTYGGGTRDAFLLEFDNTGGHKWSTFIGGSGFDDGRCLVVNSGNNVYLAGSTESSNPSTNLCNVPPTGEFPLCNSNSYFNATHGGGSDGYFLRFAGRKLVWGTYFGGSGKDFINSMAVNYLDEVFFTGGTESADYPLQISQDYNNALFTNPGPSASAGLSGPSDAILGNFDNSDDLRWSTYHSFEVGSATNGSFETGNAIAFTSGTQMWTKHFFTTGWTNSNNFLIMAHSCCPQATGPAGNVLSGTNRDAFVARFILDTPWMQSAEDNFDPEFGLSLFPNPASTEINLLITMETPGDFSIEVFSITGQKIKQETLTSLSPGRNIKKIDVSDLSQGLYFVKLSNPNYTITKKFILSK